MTAECNAGHRLKSAPLACNFNIYSAEGDKPKVLRLSLKPKALNTVSFHRTALDLNKTILINKLKMTTPFPMHP
jgi:hypothetical protein